MRMCMSVCVLVGVGVGVEIVNTTPQLLLQQQTIHALIKSQGGGWLQSELFFLEGGTSFRRVILHTLR